MDVVCPFVNRGESNQSQKAEKPPNDWGIGCCAVRLSRQNTTQYSTCTCTVLSTVHVLGVPVPVKLGIPRNVSTRLRTLKSELGHTSGIWTFLKFSMQLHPLPPTTYIRYSTVWNFQFLALFSSRHVCNCMWKIQLHISSVLRVIFLWSKQMQKIGNIFIFFL